MTDTVPVVVAMESTMVRRNLILLLEAETSIEVVAEAPDADTLLERTDGVLAPGEAPVVVIGSALPPDGADEAEAALRRQRPVLGVVVVHGPDDTLVPLTGRPEARRVTLGLDRAAHALASTVLALAAEARR